MLLLVSNKIHMYVKDKININALILGEEKITFKRLEIVSYLTKKWDITLLNILYSLHP